MNTRKFVFFALAATGEGISGGDRIFIEFARRWCKDSIVEIYTSNSGARMCKTLNMPSSVIMHPLSFGGLEYFKKIIVGINLGLHLKLENVAMVYSASEFWMDSLPALIVKLRLAKIKWAAAWYQTAPNPISGFTNGRYRFSALLYWITQLPIKPFIARFADHILINNESEKRYFPKHTNKLVVVLGAVDTSLISEFKKSIKEKSKKYEAVFQGRFHPQKGVVELVKIWRLVVDALAGAKLAMIGDGPLMDEVKSQIKLLNLEKNIDLKGYIFDGEQKYKLFSQSEIVVHPALFDSGGMASAEAMAFGLPCVGFDLDAYKSYYPEGMIKTPVGDTDMFAKNIITLLNNPALRHKIGRQAENIIYKDWSWDNRAMEILNKIS